MLSKLQTKKEEGFTIIEVLIVLAIAGLILLIVFLAVPALQRNSRNTATKNDAQNVLGGVSEYAGANNGAIPTGIAGTGTVNYTGPAGTNPTSINIQGSTTVSSVATAPAATAPALGTIVVSRGFKCNGTASPRAVAALYSIETTGATVRQCAES
ncbi:type II secretion system protein [Candidatus Saccharibacteria bacterium]|nr:type II secretion system protein [Candidatus Saccharibacteria bacterium]